MGSGQLVFLPKENKMLLPEHRFLGVRLTKAIDVCGGSLLNV